MPARGRPILTAHQNACRRRPAIEAGTPATELMERAGRALAEAVRLYVGPRETLILCGPGNNGGDGYVAARYLTAGRLSGARRGIGRTDLRRGTLGKGRLDRPDQPFAAATEAPIVIDCLFGTGLSRGLIRLFLNGFPS